MSEIEIDKYREYIEGWQCRIAVEKEAKEMHRQQACKDAEKIASFLAQNYGVKKIILFGSLVRGDFDLDSDIDLAVDGLDKARYFRALVEAGNLTEIPVEIKLLDECRGLIREHIDREGILLYEA